MSEMEPGDRAIDSLLRRSMAAPVPGIAPDFDQKVMRELRRSSKPLDRYRRMLLTGYGLVSAVTSVVVMRGQGIDWWAIAAIVLTPVALLATFPLARRARRSTTRPNTA